MKKLFYIFANISWGAKGQYNTQIKTSIKAYNAFDAHKMFIDKYVEIHNGIRIKSIMINYNSINSNENYTRVGDEENI